MKIKDLDRDEAGGQPIQSVMRWLRTLTVSPDVKWDPVQRASALEAIVGCHELLERPAPATDEACGEHELHPMGTAAELAALRRLSAAQGRALKALSGSPVMIGGLTA